MLRILQLLKLYVKRQFLEWLSWRTFLLTLVISQAASPLIGLFIWSAALPSQSTISTYYMLLLVVRLMTVSYEHHTLSNGIYGGALNHELLKPHPIIISSLGSNIAGRLTHLIVGLPFIIIALLIANISLNPTDLLLALPAFLLAALIRFLFTYTLALSAIWTTQAHAIIGFGETLLFLLGGAVAPIPLFPTTFRPIVEILPFRAMLALPAEIASGTLHNTQMLTGYFWQFIWFTLFIVLTHIIWRQGIRRYTAIGG